MKIMAFGSCRAYRSTFHMHGGEVETFRFPHRVHTVGQVERAIRYLRAPEDTRLSHTISRRAGVILSEQDAPFETLEALRTSIPPLDTFDAFIVEISSLKEHQAIADGRRVPVNSLVGHDVHRLAEHLVPFYENGSLLPLSDFSNSTPPTPDTRLAVRRIKNALNRPILWLSHANVPDTPGDANVFRIRDRVSRVVGACAATVGDQFYDPTELAERMGRRAFFAKDGRDLHHYTPAAQIELAREITARLAPGLVLANAGGEMPDDEEDDD